MTIRRKAQLFLATIFLLGIILSPSILLARGGGGGSSGGGGHSSGGHSSYSSSHSGSGGGGGEVECSSFLECRALYTKSFFIIYALILLSSLKNIKKSSLVQKPITLLKMAILPLALSLFSLVSIPVVMVFTGIIFFLQLFGKEKIAQSTELSLSTIKTNYNLDISTVFLSFQDAWCAFYTEGLKNIVTANFHEQLVLELAVLKNEGRENRMENIKLLTVSVDEKLTVANKMLCLVITATANDSLYDTVLQKKLYSDDSVFTEYWDFVKEGAVWKLSTIKQATENAALKSNEIETFALTNNFFYNPDFGWLMMPNKGSLFKDSDFQTSDINNHVIGMYKNKIVEFYSIIFSNGGTEYFIGQAILPKFYGRIVIRRKKKFTFIERGVSGLQKMHSESNAFDREYVIYADRAETIATFELLHPAYMEYIMGLPYEVNIEVVGNTVYFYTNSSKVNYDKLLEILSRAFDEIKE